MTPDDVKALISATRTTATQDRAILDLLLHSGLRCAELCDLRVSDVQGDTLTVRKGKGGRRRVIRLARTYGHWELHLRACSAGPDDFVFRTRTGEKLATSHIRRMVGRLARKAGVAGAHPHAFRHAHACCVYDGIGDLATVSRQLGHARLSTTDTYLRGLGVSLDAVASLAF
ncbi:MAG: tyrosine-type recombinase/integrase [Pirellulales bacterium]|nr:tyrosine-type recombinase/integrase [Pirellulales bacterium]